MLITDSVERTVGRSPADVAGENYSSAEPAAGHHPLEDLELLTDDMLASVARHDETVPQETGGETATVESIVARAVEAAGGKLLFQMRVGNDEDRHVAAITLGEGSERRIALAILNAEGKIRLEPIETSDNPIAGLARSYVSLAKVYNPAT